MMPGKVGRCSRLQPDPTGSRTKSARGGVELVGAVRHQGTNGLTDRKAPENPTSSHRDTQGRPSGARANRGRPWHGAYHHRLALAYRTGVSQSPSAEVLQSDVLVFVLVYLCFQGELV